MVPAREWAVISTTSSDWTSAACSCWSGTSREGPVGEHLHGGQQGPVQERDPAGIRHRHRHVDAEANAEVSRDNSEMLFVTAFAGVLDLDTGELDYCNAATSILTWSRRRMPPCEVSTAEEDHRCARWTRSPTGVRAIECAPVNCCA